MSAGVCPQRAPKNPNPRRGSAHPRAKLTEADARLIVDAHEAGLSTRTLAAKFEVSQSAIAKLVRADSWRHV